jgi:transcriptional regulator with XRE-family HTH domain
MRACRGELRNGSGSVKFEATKRKKFEWRCPPGFWERLASFCAPPRRLKVTFVRVESCVDPVALRDARLRMGLTQHELARLIDVAGGERISRWELGSSAPRPEILQRLAQALNVGASDLLDAGGPADLRRLRTSAGLSARTLARRAHMSVPTYVRWESGRAKRIPAKQALKPLAKALNVTVEDVESAIVTARANASQAD